MAVSLGKVQEKAPELVSLVKTADEVLGLRQLRGQKAKVALCLDFSGSMRRRYNSGEMQRLAEKVLALGTQLDDDGAIDLFIFDTKATYLGEVTLDNFRGAIDRYTKGRHMGTTDYAGLFRLVQDHYGFGNLGANGNGAGKLLGGLFGKKPAASTPAPLSNPANEPVFAVFLTDGAPDSRPAAIEAITKASYAPIFWQFLSIGRESIPFLEKLDDLDGRYIDNADYKPVGEVDNLSDSQLFEYLLDEYPGWVQEERRRGQIR